MTVPGKDPEIEDFETSDAWVSSVPVQFLELKRVQIATTKGDATIYRSTGLFSGWVDSDFHRFDTDRRSRPKPESELSLLELQTDATFARMFAALGGHAKIALTQSQIIQFICDHGDMLHPMGHETFFPFVVEGGVSNNEPFVAIVNGPQEQRRIRLARAKNVRTWRGSVKHRLIILA